VKPKPEWPKEWLADMYTETLHEYLARNKTHQVWENYKPVQRERDCDQSLLARIRWDDDDAGKVKHIPRSPKRHRA